MAFDVDSRVVAWNLAAETLTGWSAEEVLGRYPPHWPAAEGPPEDRRPPPPGLGIRYRKDGSTFVAVVERELPLHGEDGAPVGYARFFREAPQEEVVLIRRNELSRQLVEAVRIEEVREVLARAVEDLLGARAGVVLRPCDGLEHLHGRFALGVHQELAEDLQIPLAEGPARTAAVDRRTASGVLRLGSDDESPALLVPMGPAADGWVLGLCFRDTEVNGPAAWALGEALAAEAWTALRRAELVAELEGKVEILEATAAVSASAGHDLDEVLESVCVRAAEALSCERAGVYLREESGALRLAHLYATDLDTSVPEGHRAAEELLKAAAPMVIQDAAACPFLEGPWHHETGAVSVFGLPLRVGEQEVGVLVVAHTQAHPRGFTNLCRQVGDAAAAQAALAINNARLDRLRADYIDGLSHDLRTPLTSLLGFVETLRRTADTATAAEREEYLEIIERQARRIAGMVDDLLTSARLEAGALVTDRSTPVQAAEAIGAALETLSPECRDRVEVEVGPEDVVVRGDRLLLGRALQNLVDNALRHSPEGETVSLVARSVGEEAVITITDRGAGIDEETRRRLFTRFGSSQGRGSVGLGLYITRGIVRAHGGDVAVDSSQEAGTVFTVTLPLAREPAHAAGGTAPHAG